MSHHLLTPSSVPPTDPDPSPSRVLKPRFATPQLTHLSPCRSDLEAVVTSCVKTVLGQGPDQTADEATVAAIVRSAEFSERKKEPCMSLDDFRKWSREVPAVRRVLESLMADPEAGPRLTSFAVLSRRRSLSVLSCVTEAGVYF